jgi:hypothetical protein
MTGGALRIDRRLWGAAVILALAPANQAQAWQKPNPVTASASHPVSPLPPGSAMDHLLTQVILDNVPHSYTDDKNWGTTAKRWNGVRWRREGWKWETKRDWIEVNHGLWQRYTVRLRDPKSNFSISVSDLRPTAENRAEFALTVITPLALEARQAQWVNGIQLYSISAEAECNIRLVIHCDVGWTVDHGRQPPSVVVDPQVSKADLKVDDFRVRHISKVGGEVAQQATRWVQSRLDDQVKSREAKLVEKLNRDIDRHRDDLVLPLDEIVDTRWLERLIGSGPPPAASVEAVDAASERPGK